MQHIRSVLGQLPIFFEKKNVILDNLILQIIKQKQNLIKKKVTI